MTVRSRLAGAVVALVFLAACAGPDSGEGILNESYEGALPLQTQLILGTIKLEEGDAAVTAEQAAVLIPLWKAVRSLSASDTAAEAEIEALAGQIQGSMTEQQLQAIAAMQLTQQDMFTAMQELGPQLGGGEQGDQGFNFGGGQGPGGGPPEGFAIQGDAPEGFQGGPGGGQAFTQDLDPDQIATLQAERGGQAPGVGRGALFLIEPLLEMLEARAGS